MKGKYTYHETFPLKSFNVSLLNDNIVVKKDFIFTSFTLLLIKEGVRGEEYTKLSSKEDENS
jgi:hypothetical protein